MKGNVLVGQSGGPTAAINASLAGVYKTALELGIETVYGMRYGIDGFIHGKYVDMSDYVKSDLDFELLKRTPSSFLGSCRYKLPEPDVDASDYEIIFKRFSELDIKYVFYIGGNDSMDTIKKLSAYGERINSDIRFVGVPKTIDNDLAATDHTPGYGSAAKYIAASVKEIIRDSMVYDINSVTIVEIMGRNAGWLTAAAALAEGADSAGPDLIYLPEKSFDRTDFLTGVEAAAKERHNVIVAVSEGIKTPDGHYLCDGLFENTGTDAFGHAMLGGTALALSGLISSALGIKSRGIVLSTLQRSAAHMLSLCDANEAYIAGAEAVKRALEGMSGIMITFCRTSDLPYQMTVGTADIRKIANEERLVPSEWILDGGKLEKESVRRYISPLISGELEPIMVNGVPAHLIIK